MEQLVERFVYFVDNGPQVLLKVSQSFAAATLNRRFQFLFMQGEIWTNY
jgi:hypothetical protein